MCGIAGLVDLARRSDAEQIRKTVTRMIEPIAHRGPDDARRADCGEARRSCALGLGVARDGSRAATEVE